MQQKQGSNEESQRGVFLLAGVLCISAVLGGMFGPRARAVAANSNDLQDSVKSFTHVLSVVEQNYAEPVDVDRAIYDGAIPGMLRVLDPHSSFFDPKQYASFREQQLGRYYGVGMQIEQRLTKVVVVSPFVGSPAFKAGIRPGDTILKVDDKSCDNLTVNDVADLLRGARGTPVHIVLGREGWTKPIDVTVVRDEIPRPGVDYFEMVKPGIGYVHVATFNETTDSDLADALKQLDYPKLDGLIIDLRENRGGLLNQAVGMADMFLDKNELVVSHHGRASQEQRYYARHGNQGVDVPITVLVNSNSASASEIVSGAIQDHDRGLIVGETSFGKGLVQTQYPLSEDTALLLTTARYYTPSGRLIQRDYKNQTLYDYEYNPQPPKTPEVKLTDSGRQVYGGGGITPDDRVPMPKVNDFEKLLLRRGVFVINPSGTLDDPYVPDPVTVGEFAGYYLSTKPDITRDFEVDDAVMASFKKYLAQEHIQVSDWDMQQSDAWIKWEIKREVDTTVFGLDAGNKVALENDPQLEKAIDVLPQSKALYQTARKVVAEREASQSRLQP